MKEIRCPYCHAPMWETKCSYCDPTYKSETKTKSDLEPKMVSYTRTEFGNECSDGNIYMDRETYLRMARSLGFTQSSICPEGIYSQIKTYRGKEIVII